MQKRAARSGLMKSRRKSKSGPSTAPRPTPVHAPGPVAPRWWWHVLVVLGLLLGNSWLYHGTLALDFFSVDDADYVLNNPYLEHFSAANLKHILTVPYAANYAPAHILSYALDVALAGGKKSAFAMHLANALWHGWVVCMVYWLAFTLRAETASATAAALLFMLHPAHVEVVAWISSRKDLIATGFAVLAMTCYLRYRRPARGRALWFAASLLGFLLASAGKQSVALLPAVMLVWDVLVEKRCNWQMLVDKIPFGLITVFFGWMTWHAQPSTNQPPQVFFLAGTELANLWLLTGLGDYVLYRGAPDAAAWSPTLRALIILAAGLAWLLPLLWLRARQPLCAALGYWMLIQMIPPMVPGFVVPITDRYLFLPSVGVSILLADVVAGLTRRWPKARGLCWCLLAGLATIWGAKTWSYVNEWRDPRSVWHGAHLKTKTPQVAQFLGEVYQNAGDRMNNFIKSGTPLAVTNELKLARALFGDTASVERLQTEWLAAGADRTDSIAYRDRLWNLAWEQYEAALARRGTLSMPNLFMNRGRLLVSQGQFAKAIPEFQTALKFAQTSAYELIRQETVTHALFAIGVAHWNLRDYWEAEQWLLKAQDLQKKSVQVWIPDLDQQVERIKTLAAGQE